MNDHERNAWRALVELGAKSVDFGGKPGLDLRTVRIKGLRAKSIFIDAVVNVAGRSGSVRRHMDRAGRLVYVVTDPDPRSE